MTTNIEASLFENEPPAYAPIEPMPPDRQLVRIGRQLPEGVFLGSSSWNFPGWRGIVWAPMSGVRGLATRGLKAYAQYPIFRTVGIDRSFYEPLSVEQYRMFADQVPDNFRFLIKAPQLVTDSVMRDGRGRPVESNAAYLDSSLALEKFIAPVIEGLGEKAGPLVFELPPLPAFTLREVAQRRAETDRIIEFLSKLPVQVGTIKPLYAVEMRSRGLLTPRFIRGVRPTGVRPVISLHPTMPAVMRQIEMLRALDAPENLSGDWKLTGDLVVRWSLAAESTYEARKRDWRPFHQLQQPDVVNREGIAWLIKQAVKSRVRAFCVANNKAEGCAPLTMRAIAQSVVHA